MRKRSKSKEAKFFCESCGSEVPRNSKVCPTCGYAINPDSLYGRGSGSIPGIGATSGRFGKGRNGSGLAAIFGNSGRSSSSAYTDSSLPFWIYAVSIIILVGLVIGLYSCL